MESLDLLASCLPKRFTERGGQTLEWRSESLWRGNGVTQFPICRLFFVQKGPFVFANWQKLFSNFPISRHLHALSLSWSLANKIWIRMHDSDSGRIYGLIKRGWFIVRNFAYRWCPRHELTFYCLVFIHWEGGGVGSDSWWSFPLCSWHYGQMSFPFLLSAASFL